MWSLTTSPRFAATRLIAPLALALAMALPAQAVTVSGTVNEPGDFSSDWLSPSVIASGTTQINGTASDLDVLKLTGLNAGAQVLSFVFSALQTYTSGNLSAGGSILYKTTPFGYAWDQDGRVDYAVSYNSWNVGTPWAGSTGSLTSTASLALDAAFAGGSLYLAIVPWNGTALTYGITVPAGTAVRPSVPAAVPLPAAGLMLAGAMGLMAALRRRRA